MKIAEVLPQMIETLRKAGFDQPAYEARELLKHLTGMSAADLVSRDETALNPDQEKKLYDWMQKRQKGTPLAYLTKEKGFFKHVFAVEPGVLIPRPETELVVEVAFRRAASLSIEIKQIADLGAGSGCIGLSLVFDWRKAKLWSVESSPRAASVVVTNAEALQVYERVHVDCIAVESWDPETKFDLIVSNPPYIAKGDERVQKSVHEHEPHAALYSGDDGLDAIRNWVPKAFQLLNPEGLFVCEIGAGQSAEVQAIMMRAGFRDIEVNRDLAGIQRVVSAKR